MTSVGNVPPAGGTPPPVPGRHLDPRFYMIFEYELSLRVDMKPYSEELGHAHNHFIADASEVVSFGRPNIYGHTLG